MTNDYGNLELHQQFLSAMIDFHELCEKHGLKYCLHGGTALGAIRHKGFIPWDDDVDIAMLRQDYDRFLEIAQSEFGEKYTVQTYRSEPNMLTNFTKIRINGSEYICEGNESNTCAFLDVFPMSDVPNSKFLQRIQNKLAIFINNIVSAKIGYITPTSFKARVILTALSKLKRQFLGRVLELVITRFPHRNSQYVNIVATANYSGNTGYATDLWPKELYEERELVDFCGERFYIMKQWDAYLTRMYGDYMTPPEYSKRTNKHGVKKVSEAE
jgi:lipopolysaccharide cholinephosphotransferase